MIRQDSDKFVAADPEGWSKTQCWSVHCTRCPTKSRKHGADPGEAADLARKEGFQTVFGKASEPSKWICKGCAKVSARQVK